PFRQANVGTAGVDQRIGIFAQQAVVSGLSRQRNGIGVGFRAVSPTIEDDEDEWFWTRHRLLASSCRINSFHHRDTETQRNEASTAAQLLPTGHHTSVAE